MEIWLKIAFCVDFALLILLVVRVARRLRARPDTAVDQSGHEVPALRWIRPLLGLVFYGAMIDWLLPGTRLDFARLPLAPAARWAGEGLALAGIALLGWSFEALGRDYRGGVGLWDDHRLVTSGPYGRIRHPIYLGFLVLMLGIALLSADWLAGAAGLLLTASIPLLRVPIEDAELAERFGPAYREYRARTGAFLPRIRAPRS